MFRLEDIFSSLENPLPLDEGGALDFAAFKYPLRLTCKGIQIHLKST